MAHPSQVCIARSLLPLQTPGAQRRYGTTTCTSAEASPVPALFTARTRTK